LLARLGNWRKPAKPWPQADRGSPPSKSPVIDWPFAGHGYSNARPVTAPVSPGCVLEHVGNKTERKARDPAAEGTEPAGGMWARLGMGSNTFRQPGDPRGTHGFASPPYDGFALSRKWRTDRHGPWSSKSLAPTELAVKRVQKRCSACVSVKRLHDSALPSDERFPRRLRKNERCADSHGSAGRVVCTPCVQRMAHP
jgi:hypothetical protein